MTRKEEILLATIDLASERGLKAVTLSQIAERVGIRKASLYNHFRSKDDILASAYQLLRDKARERAERQATDDVAHPGEGLEAVLLRSFERYGSFVLDEEMLRFFKVLYAERATSPLAAQIMVDETDRMVRQVKGLFYDLAAHGRLRCDDVEMAALSFAMSVHALVDRQMDVLTAEGLPTSGPDVFGEVRSYITWFARQMGQSDE